MTNLRQAAQQALEALLNFPDDISDEMFESITALKAALAQPEQDTSAYHGWVLREVLFDNGEPVGHREPEQEPDGISWLKRDSDYFTAPTPRKPLTDEELEPLLDAVPFYDIGNKDLINLARAIERAHGITGETNE